MVGENLLLNDFAIKVPWNELKHTAFVDNIAFDARLSCPIFNCRIFDDSIFQDRFSVHKKQSRHGKLNKMLQIRQPKSFREIQEIDIEKSE